MEIIKEAENKVLQLHDLYDGVQDLQRKLTSRTPSKNGNPELEREIQEKSRSLFSETQLFIRKYLPYKTEKLIDDFIDQADNISVGALRIVNNPYKRF